MLAGIAIRIEDFEQAEEWLTKAEAAGLSSEQLRFERAAIAVLKGKVDDALANLKALVKTDKENVRAWALLAFLTDDGSDPKTYEHALKTLSNLRGTSPEVRLTLAELYMNKKRWSDARSELDQVLRMNPRKVLAWEKLVMVDFHERKRDLAEDHVRVLLTLAPENYTGNLMLGSFQYARGQLALAESSYRAALKTRREPEVLNDLAYIIMLKGGAMEEARSLINEGLALEPSHPILLSTRGEINLREGRLDEAEQDLQQALSAMPENPQAMLLTAQLYAARGLEADALKLAETLAERASELPTEQQDELQKLIKRLR
jgi:predicted Zn-dependent protease